MQTETTNSPSAGTDSAAAPAAGMDKPDLNSLEMLRDPFGTLQKYYGGWIKDNRIFITQFWETNNLFQHVRMTRDDDDNVVHRESSQLVVAGSRDTGKLLGLTLEVYGTDVSKTNGQKLVGDGKALFVVGPSSAVAAWMQRKYPGRILTYDHRDLDSIYVARLESFVFGWRDEYKLLQMSPSTGAVSVTQWKQAREMGEQVRETARLDAIPSTILQLPDLLPGARGSQWLGKDGDFGVELMPQKVGQEAVEERLGKIKNPRATIPRAGHDPVTFKGRGMNTLMGDMGLVQTNPVHKRKLSDVADEEGTEGSDKDQEEVLAKKKKKKKKIAMRKEDTSLRVKTKETIDQTLEESKTAKEREQDHVRDMHQNGAPTFYEAGCEDAATEGECKELLRR